MALTDTKKDLLLGASVGEVVQNADDNFTSLFDSVDELNDKIPTQTSQLTNNSGFITKDANNLTNYTVKSETGTDIEMSVDENYVLTLKLKNASGTVVSTQTVDLPIESLVVDASYADGKLTLELQNGNTVDVDISALISGLVPDTRTVNGFSLKSNINLTQDHIGDGTTYKRVKSGGDITFNTDGTVKVVSVGGKTAEQIGRVQGIKVNEVEQQLVDGYVNIAIDDLTSEYTSVTASTTKEINGTTYYGFNVAETDTAFEVYKKLQSADTDMQQIVTHRVRKADGNTFVACATTSGTTVYIRKLKGGAVGKGLYRHTIYVLINEKEYKATVYSNVATPVTSRAILKTVTTDTVFWLPSGTNTTTTYSYSSVWNNPSNESANWYGFTLAGKHEPVGITYIKSFSDTVTAL